MGGYLASLAIKHEKGEIDKDYLLTTIRGLEILTKNIAVLVNELYKEVHTNQTDTQEGW